MLSKYYKDKDYKNFVILYLLLNYNTRNKDLVARVVNNEADINQKEKFFNLFREKDVVYIRNELTRQTNTYGMKQDVIVAKKLFNAVKEVDKLLENRR